MTENSEKIILCIDRDLKDIIPDYLESRLKDVTRLSERLEERDFESLQVLGHRMKGTGAAYGFDTITDIGHDVEMAAKNKAYQTIETCIFTLASYLKQVDIRYEIE